MGLGDVIRHSVRSLIAMSVLCIRDTQHIVRLSWRICILKSPSWRGFSVSHSAIQKALRHPTIFRECAEWQGRPYFTLCKVRVVSLSFENNEWTEIRIIIAFEDEFRAYQETLAATIRILRPEAEVTTAEPEKISWVAKRFSPDIVIGNTCKDTDLEGVPAWIDLSLDPAQVTRVNVDGEYSEIANPTLDKLLAIIEEVAQLTRTGDL
jgi:hypothetical protein